jgi:hypothetical protein
VHATSPEYQALTGCINAGLQPWPDAGTTPVLRISPTLDWDRLFELSTWHGVEGLVHAALVRAVTVGGSAGDIVPSGLLEKLGATTAVMSMRTSFLLAQRQPVCQALTANQIPVMLLKGAALLESVYTSAASRSMGDLDLLVPESEVGAAVEALHAIGFRSDAAQMNRWPVTHRHVPRLISRDSAAVVELHRHILSGADVASIAPMWERAQPGREGTWLTPSPTDMVVHLALHFTEDRTYHLRFALRQLADLASVIRMTPSQVDWDVVGAEARRLDRSTSVFFALYAVQEIIGTPIPDDVLPLLAPPGCTRAIRRRFLDRWVLATGQREAVEVLAARVAAGGRRQTGWAPLIRRFAPLLGHPAAAVEDVRLNRLVKPEPWG